MTSAQVRPVLSRMSLVLSRASTELWILRAIGRASATVPYHPSVSSFAEETKSEYELHFPRAGEFQKSDALSPCFLKSDLTSSHHDKGITTCACGNLRISCVRSICVLCRRRASCIRIYVSCSTFYHFGDILLSTRYVSAYIDIHQYNILIHIRGIKGAREEKDNSRISTWRKQV